MLNAPPQISICYLKLSCMRWWRWHEYKLLRLLRPYFPGRCVSASTCPSSDDGSHVQTPQIESRRCYFRGEKRNQGMFTNYLSKIAKRISALITHTLITVAMIQLSPSTTATNWKCARVLAQVPMWSPLSPASSSLPLVDVNYVKKKKKKYTTSVFWVNTYGLCCEAS